MASQSPTRQLGQGSKSDKNSGIKTLSSSSFRKASKFKIFRRHSFHKNKRAAQNEVDSEAKVRKETQKRNKKSRRARDLEDLKKYHKEFRTAVKYFTLLLERSELEILMAKIPDNATLVLESIINIDTMLDTCIRLKTTKEFIKPYRSAMHQCIGDVVKWTDQLLVRGATEADKAKGQPFICAVETSVQELMEVVVPRLHKENLHDEIRNSIFLFEDDHLLVPDDAQCELSSGKARRDSGISDASGSDMLGARESPPPKPPLPTFTMRDSGRGSYNHINDMNHTSCSSPESSPYNSQERLLSPPDMYPTLKTGGRSRSRARSYMDDLQMDKSFLREADFSTNSCFIRTPPDTPGSYLDETRHVYRSAQSSCSSFLSADERDSVHSYEHDSEEDGVIKASFVGVVDNHAPPQLAKTTRSFQVYIELLGNNYIQPSEEILMRPTSLSLDTRSNSMTSSSPSPKNEFAVNEDRMNGYHDRQNAVPRIPPKSPSRLQPPLDWNRNPRTPEGTLTKKKVLPLSEEDIRNSRKESDFSASSSSLSSTDEDESTPALDCIDVSRFLVTRKEDDGSQMLTGGAIDALLVHATGANKSDLAFHDAFLTTYRTFITPKELINKLLYRERRFKERGHKKASQSAFFLLLQVVDELTGKVEKSILEQLIREVYRHLINGHLVVARLLRDKMLPKCENYYKTTQLVSHPNPKKEGESKCSILDFQSDDLAKQLTLLDAKNFHAIDFPEILAWGKEQNEEKSPNLAIYTEHFNKVSYWCRTHLLSFDKQQDREKVYSKFLKIMKHLRRFNNFNSLLALLSALDCSAVRRLDWPRSLQEQLSEYVALIDSSSSFRTYRAALAGAEAPCIPYLGLILQDVTFVYLGNADELPDGKINFVKRWQLFNILHNVRRFKLENYKFESDEQILHFFNDFEKYLSEDDLFEKSLMLKPRSDSRLK